MKRFSLAAFTAIVVAGLAMPATAVPPSPFWFEQMGMDTGTPSIDAAEAPDDDYCTDDFCAVDLDPGEPPPPCDDCDDPLTEEATRAEEAWMAEHYPDGWAGDAGDPDPYEVWLAAQ
jgi:hypothetical protein